VVSLFSAIGAEVTPSGSIDLGAAELRIVHEPEAGDGRLLVGDPTEGDEPPAPAAGAADAVRLAALGWGTVDLERAAEAFGRPSQGDLVGDTLLGARGQALATSGAFRIVLLEPSTEGRLAAALARHGEGPVTLYLSGGRAIDDDEPPDAAAPAATALGPGRLAHAPRGGPFVIRLGSDG
jgi:hypothetical protein